MEKNLSKEEEKEKDKEKGINNNDLLSMSNSQKNADIRKTQPYIYTNFTHLEIGDPDLNASKYKPKVERKIYYC